MSVKASNIKGRVTTDNHFKVTKKSKVFEYISFYVIILLAIAAILIPMYIMILCSFMTAKETNDAAFHWWPQEGFSVEGYQAAFQTDLGGVTLIGGFFNTLWIYIPALVIGILISSLAAYAFAKMEFKAKKVAFAILMFGMTLPNCMGTVARVILFEGMGWLDTILPLTVPLAIGSIGIVFFLRQFYMSVPNDLVEAGYIDGFGDFQIFLRIMLPLAIPSMLSQFVLVFISCFNDYLSPLLYLPNTAEIAPIALVIQNFSGAYGQIWCLKMAACVITLVPLMILYLISQKFILKGVAITSGLKG